MPSFLTSLSLDLRIEGRRREETRSHEADTRGLQQALGWGWGAGGTRQGTSHLSDFGLSVCACECVYLKTNNEWEGTATRRRKGPWVTPYQAQHGLRTHLSAHAIHTCTCTHIHLHYTLTHTHLHTYATHTHSHTVPSHTCHTYIMHSHFASSCWIQGPSS